jgi:uncharacterized membrane protein
MKHWYSTIHRWHRPGMNILLVCCIGIAAFILLTDQQTPRAIWPYGLLLITVIIYFLIRRKRAGGGV